MRPEGHDVVLVGADLPALIAAERLAASGRSVDALLPDLSGPTESRHSDEFSLLSSVLGLRNLVDRRSYYEGLETLEYFGFGRPSTRGLLGIAGEVTTYIDRASSLRISKEIRHVESPEVRERLGGFFKSGLTYFDVPCALFPVDELSRLARDRAVAQGVSFHEGSVSLEKSTGASNGYFIRFDDTLIDPTVALVSATARTRDLVANLFPTRDLSLRHSLCLEVHDSGGLPTFVLADDRAGMVVISWSKVDHPPHGRLLIVPSRYFLFGDDSRDIPGEPTQELQGSLLDYIPTAMPIATLGHRFLTPLTAVEGSASRPSARDSHYAPRDFPGLIFTMPGTHTSALVRARTLLATIRRRQLQKVPALDLADIVPRFQIDIPEPLSYDSDHIRKGNDYNDDNSPQHIAQNISSRKY